MKKILIEIILFSSFMMIILPSFANEKEIRNSYSNMNVFPKDSCIQIFSTNKNGYNILKFKRVCGFNVEIAVDIWCKYIIFNKKTGISTIYEIRDYLWPHELEKVVEWIPDTLGEYGSILDYSVEPYYLSWGGYYQAYSLGGERLYRYDVEIQKNSESQQYYALYYSSVEYNALQECPIFLTSPDHITFSLNIADDNSIKDVTINAQITKNGLSGNMNVDKQVTIYRDNRNRVVDVSECNNCSNVIIVYKKTDAHGIIKSKQ